jgi:type I restriction enzyme S subunit
LFSSLDKGISELKTAQEQLKIYRQAVLKKAFEGELTREWREQQTNLPTAEELLEQIKEERKKYYEKQLKDWEVGVQQWEKGGRKGTKPGKPSKLKDYNEIKGNEKLINIPKEWYGSYLGYVIEEPRYGTSKKCSYEKSGIGVLRIPNISNGSINDLDLKFAEFSEEEIYNYRLFENDLLTIRSNGSVDLVGKCAIITKKDTNYLYAGYLIRLRPLEDVIEPKYLYYSLSSIDLRVQIETKAKSTSGVNNINSGELESLIFPLCSLPEQNQIVLEIEKRLSVCDKMEETIKISLEKANALRQSILKKAFDGKLLTEEEIEACKREADYEPASVLLGRIQEEKEKNR